MLIVSIFVLLFFNINLSYVVIPFDILVEKYDTSEKNESLYNTTKLLKEWFSFDLFSKLKIGTPNQEISMYINHDSSCFEFNQFKSEFTDFNKLSYFFSDNEQPINIFLYNMTSSESFKDISEEYSGSFNSYRYIMGNDELFIYNNFNTDNNVIKTNNLNFQISKTNEPGIDCRKENCGGYLGLEMFNQDRNCPNFINQLKKAELINKKIFSIHYFSQKSGSLIFGAYPHEYQQDKYKEEALFSCYTKPGDNNKISNFIIYPDEIKSINDENNQEALISNKDRLVFEFYYGFFVGSSSYQKYIANYYFNDLIDKNICFNDNRTSLGGGLFYDVYSCQGDKINDIKNKFPSLKFYIKETNTSFIFEFDDLFLKIGNKYYFLVIFEKYPGDYWIIGYPFFKKYELVFDGDSKTISYYNMDLINEIKYKEKSKLYKIMIIVVLCVIIFCGLLVIGFYFGKEKYMQRKKRANELNDDDYDYVSGEKEHEGDEEKNNPKIINEE